jgi:hypothetical protein
MDFYKILINVCIFTVMPHNKNLTVIKWLEGKKRRECFFVQDSQSH